MRKAPKTQSREDSSRAEVRREKRALGGVRPFPRFQPRFADTAPPDGAVTRPQTAGCLVQPAGRRPDPEGAGVYMPPYPGLYVPLSTLVDMAPTSSRMSRATRLPRGPPISLFCAGTCFGAAFGTGSSLSGRGAIGRFIVGLLNKPGVVHCTPP